MTWPPSYRFIQAVVNWWWMPLHRIPRRSSSGRMEKDSGALEALSFFVQRRAVCGKHMDMLWTIYIYLYLYSYLYSFIFVYINVSWCNDTHVATAAGAAHADVDACDAGGIPCGCWTSSSSVFARTLARHHGWSWLTLMDHQFTKIQDLRHPTSCRR